MEKLYTVEDVAQFTGLTSRTIRTYLAEGRLVGRKVGAQWRFTEAQVEALFDEQPRRKGAVGEAAEASAQGSAQEQLSSFLSPQPRERVMACTVIDYPAESEEALGSIYSLAKAQAEGFGEQELTLAYHYDADNRVGRFTIIGPVECIAKLTKTIRRA